MYLLILFSIGVRAQENFQINGKVNTEGDSLSFVNLYLENTTKGSVSNENGTYEISNISAGNYTIIASFTGFKTQKKNIKITNKNISVNFDLISNETLDEIVITGTLKPVSRLESPVPVEIYSPSFLKKNPTPNIFEALLDSKFLISTLPLVPNSPLVKSIIPTFFPFEISFAIVPPQPNSTSSGCAPKASISNLIFFI